MGTRSCERCRSRAGTPYAFHYGRVAGVGVGHWRSAGGGAPQRTTAAQVTIGGTDAAYVCHRCLRRARLRRAGKVLLREFTGLPLLWLVYALPVLWAGATMGRGHWLTSLLWLAVVIGVPVVMLGLIYALMRPQATGEWAAIRLHRAALEEQGWKECWTTSSFAKIHAGLPV